MRHRHSGIVNRVRRGLSEMEYAQRRLFSLRTGVAAPAGRSRDHRGAAPPSSPRRRREHDT